MRTNKSSTTKGPVRRPGTRYLPQNSHKRYYLPSSLSCRLTTSQRPTEFTQQLAANPSFFILVFRLVEPISLPLFHTHPESSKPMDGAGNRRIVQGT